MTSTRQQNAGYPLPDVIETSETMSICVTFPYSPEYRDAFFGAIGELTKWWNWQKSYTPGDERAKDAAQLWRDVMTYLIVSSCEGDSMLDYRDNPLDPCEVQYSKDGGVTWETMFRKDVCLLAVPPPMSITIITISTTTITENNIVYSGDIVNVAPKFYYDPADPLDVIAVNKSICWTIQKFVEWICEGRIQDIKSANYLTRTVDEIAGGLADILGGIMSSLYVDTIGPTATLVNAAAWAASKVWNAVIDAALVAGETEFADEVAREEVMCYMYGNLKDKTIQFIDWNTCLDGFVPANDAETYISDSVRVLLNDEDTYVNFLMCANNVKDIAASLPYCPCASDFVINQLAGPTFNELYGTALTEPTTVPLGSPGDVHYVAPANYRVEDYYSGIQAPIGGTAGNVRVLLPANSLVLRVRVYMGAQRPGTVSAGEKKADIWLGDPAGGGVHVGGHTWGAGIYTLQTITTDSRDGIHFITQPADYLYVHNSIDKEWADGGGAGIYWIYIEGILSP